MLQAKTYFPTVTLLPRFYKSLARYYKKTCGWKYPTLPFLPPTRRAPTKWLGRFIRQSTFKYWVHTTNLIVGTLL